MEDKTGMTGQPETYNRPARAWASWLRLEAALSLVWRRRGVLEGELAEASGRLFCT